MVNNNPDILPHHLLCITFDTSHLSSEILDMAYSNIVNTNTVPVVIDALNSQLSQIFQSFLLPFSIPIVHFGFLHAMESIEPAYLAKVITDPSKHVVEIENEVLSRLARKFRFAVGPQYTIVYQAINGMARRFGWSRIGVVVASESSSAEPFDSFTAQGIFTQSVRIANLTVSIIIGCYYFQIQIHLFLLYRIRPFKDFPSICSK